MSGESGGSSGPPVRERIFGLLVRLYPPAFRAEYEQELLATFRDWREGSGTGVGRELRFWTAVAADLARSVPREWLSSVPAEDPRRPAYAAACLAGLAVLVLYVTTMSPTAAFWDAGEYLTVGHILGIPHPPGSALFVVIARAWDVLWAPTGLPPAVRLNVLNAMLSAGAHVFWFLLVDRALTGWTGTRAVRRLAAGSAVLLSATAFTVWNQSTVAEKVYGLSFLTVALVSWLVVRWRDGGRAGDRDPKLLLLAAFVTALSATNHLMGLLVAPAAVLFILLVDRHALLRPRLWLAGLPLVAVALSAHLVLPIRAEQRPLISEFEPACESLAGAAVSVYSGGRAGCEALSAVLTRAEYGKPPLLSDPTDPRMPRGPGLVAAQAVNYLQYLDWQWARGLAGEDPLFGGIRPLLTLAFLLLGLVGARAHWRSDRDGAAFLLTLFLTLSVALVAYMNFKYGYAIARDRFPALEMHEVRERDYFFLISFSVWGLWAGLGVVALWRAAAAWVGARVRRPGLVVAPVLGLALLPLALNLGWASRADDYTARDWAYNVLMSVEPYGVLVTNGDNDSFPLWYLQKVERVREDVSIVLSPYLNRGWYVKQLRQLTEPCPPGVDPADDPTRIVCQRPFDPAELPAPLVRAGWAESARPPDDSIFPLTDDEIDRIAGAYFVTREPLKLRAGGLRTTIEPGTRVFPADAFAAAMLQATLGDRPIHFMPGSSIVTTLGLAAHTIRRGVVWKLHDETAPPGDLARGVVPLSRGALAGMAGAAIDLPLTDTLLWEVYTRRGRIMDPDAPWVDAATANIPYHYVYAHYVAAQAHATAGRGQEVERHLARATWWERVVGG